MSRHGCCAHHSANEPVGPTLPLNAPEQQIDVVVGWPHDGENLLRAVLAGDVLDREARLLQKLLADR